MTKIGDHTRVSKYKKYFCKGLHPKLIRGSLGRHWLPMATNNLPIDKQCTIIAFLKKLSITIGTD